MRLAGQRALITGGAKGLGRAMVSAFAREGARVLIFDTDSAAAAATQEQLRREGLDVSTVIGSVAKTADVEQAFERVDRQFGGIDVLVNNAGISSNYPTLELADELWDRALDVNLRGPFLCARAAGRRMVAQQSGHILNIASIYGVVAAPERLAYCVSKSAVAMMAKALASEWGASGVRVNALAPGYVRTAMIDELIALGRIDLDRLRDRTPLKKLAEPDDVAEMAVFLSSAAARHITGQVVAVDGGWTAYGYL